MKPFKLVRILKATLFSIRPLDDLHRTMNCVIAAACVQVGEYVHDREKERGRRAREKKSETPQDNSSRLDDMISVDIPQK